VLFYSSTGWLPGHTENGHSIAAQPQVGHE